MILDVEKAVIDYLTSNMSSIVGTGNESVEIYRYYFPDDADPEAITVHDELPSADSGVPEINLDGVRIIVRSAKPDTAFKMIQNIDLLLDKMVRKNFNSEVECCLCSRNSGPVRFIGINGLYHYTTLFTMTLRSR